jgi:hypothetical protein
LPGFASHRPIRVARLGARRPGHFCSALSPAQSGTGLVGSIPAGAARWLRGLFSLFSLFLSACEVCCLRSFLLSVFVSACGLSICVQSPALDSFSLHGPCARSDFLASASVLRGDLWSWFLSSSCVKLSPSTGFSNEFHQALQKIQFLYRFMCVLLKELVPVMFLSLQIKWLEFF